MVYGYARVSTQGQARYGNSLTEQEQKLRQAGASVIYTDAFTGTRVDRPELTRLLEVLEPGDTLVVCKLDRLARSAAQGSELVGSLLEQGVTVNILNMGVINDTPTGRLTMHIFFAFAEFERDMIVQRMSEGKQVARLKDGYREGRPRKVVPEFEAFYKRVQARELTVAAACAHLQISKGKWYALVKEGVSSGEDR